MFRGGRYDIHEERFAALPPTGAVPSNRAGGR
jgi:hypothetical protein